MRKLLFTVAATFGLNASASVSEVELQKCAAISSGKQRLACYDGHLRSKVSGERVAGKWRVSTNTNPIDDSKTVTAIVDADSGVNEYGKKPSLVVRCKSGKPELYVTWDQYLGSEANVLTRVGDNPAFNMPWNLSTDSKATFHPSAVGLLWDIENEKRLVFQVVPYSSNPITAIFNVAGSLEALQPLREACGLKTAKELGYT